MVASNRFLPNFGRPPSQMRGGAPLPQDRPYDLGQSDRVASAYPQARTSADASLLASQALSRHRSDVRLADVSPDTEPLPPATRPRVVQRRFVAPVDAVSSADAAPPMRWTPGPPAVSPVTAYAPVHEPARAITTGRGLY
jgi:hypothetical protein